MNAEREIRDMDNKLKVLSDWTLSLSGVINDEILTAISDVIDEWDSYTKPLILELDSKIQGE